MAICADLRQDIIESVSTLRSIFVNLRNSGEEKTTKINQLSVELKAKTELMENRKDNLSRDSLPSRGGNGQNIVTAHHTQLTPSGGPRKKLYSEAVSASEEKRYKLMVKPKLDLSTEEVKTTLRTKVNRTTMKVGVRTLKSLKDGRVLIEAGTTEEINKLKQTIQEKCGGGGLEVVAPQLRKPRVVINNVPNDITVGNLEEVIIAQNPELELVRGDMEAKFMYSTKRGQNKIVVEVGQEI